MQPGSRRPAFLRGMDMRLLVKPSIIYSVFFKPDGHKNYDWDEVEFYYRPSDTIARSVVRVGDAFLFRLGGMRVFLPVQAIIGMYELLEMAADRLDDKTARNRDMWLRNRNGESLKEIAADFGLQPATVRENIKRYKRTWQYHIECRIECRNENKPTPTP